MNLVKKQKFGHQNMLESFYWEYFQKVWRPLLLEINVSRDYWI